MAIEDEAVVGREAAARRWKRLAVVCLFVGMAGALLAMVGELFGSGGALLFTVLVGASLVAIALVGVFAAAIGIGWTRGYAWHRSLWNGVKAVGSTLKMLFL